MMIDDHDVTDDWNLTCENSDKVRTIPFSRRVITNAISAAWVFQLWGNDPERFGLFRTKISAAYAHHHLEQLRWLETHFIDQRFWWGFSIPSQPPTLVLDTRTRRAYDNDSLALMDISAFDESSKLMATMDIKNTLILLSPAPMFGFSMVEALQLQFKKNNATTIDREPWVANLEALRQLKNCCMTSPSVKHVIILSGDVHYGFHRYENYQHPQSKERVHFWQLTSSSACNIPPGKSIGQFVVAQWLPAIGKHVNSFLNRWRLRAHRKHKARYLLPMNQTDFITAGTNVGLVVLDSQGNPSRSYLYNADAATSDTCVWEYDLVTPRILEL
jgi:hypothetical protein